jgi:hypothetical protein
MSDTYSGAFNGWLKEHRFDGMTKSVRSVAIELNENVRAIEAWRATLSDKKRKRLIHPLSNMRAWRKATNPQPRQSRIKLKPPAMLGGLRFAFGWGASW